MTVSIEGDYMSIFDIGIDEKNIGYRPCTDDVYERVYENLESQKQQFYSDINDMTYEIACDELSQNRTIKNLTNPHIHLHHSIGHPCDDMKTLEFFLEEDAIVAGEKIPNYGYDEMNSNEGRFISLLAFKGVDLEYEAFITEREKISLMINPAINPLEAKYVCEDMFRYIAQHHKDHKNRYAWCHNEFQIDRIDFSFVDCIGIPYCQYKRRKGEEYAKKRLDALVSLLAKYGYDLPIYDNITLKVIREPKKEKEPQMT